jgi:polysaccharide export outer membrane protein
MNDRLKRPLYACVLSFGLAAMAGCGSTASGIRFQGATASQDAPRETAQDTASPPINLITPQLLRAEKEKREKESGADISQLIGPAAPYTIESGDQISVTVWDHPELGGGSIATSSTSGFNASAPVVPASFTVNQQGAIQYPYVGMLQFAGLTEPQARELLTTRLAHYIKNPSVTLTVQSYRSKRIYVDGEVKMPGVQTINDIPMTLMEAINRAGGFQTSADQSQITLNRKGTLYRINLPQLVQRGVNPANIMLVNGDVLRVRPRDESKVFVSGEVIGPRALQMHNGRLSLSEALGESGGINPLTGDARQIYVVRKSSAEPMVYQLNADNSGALALAEGFELEPKDIIYVAATPLTNWYRTISQIFPVGIPSPATLIPGR